MELKRPDILGQREATIDDAPVALSNDEAHVWVNGFNSARDLMLGHTDVLRYEIDRLREELRGVEAMLAQAQQTAMLNHRAYLCEYIHMA